MPLRARFVLLAFGLVALAGCGGGVSDPESARCNNPKPTFGQATDLGDHREVGVHFTCEGAVLAGTLYLPNTKGRFPGVVWVHGSGEQPRLTYGSVVAPLVEQGIAVFSYDKRGVGESEGQCCPGDQGHFNLLSADASGAINALLSRTDIDPSRIGLIGASQAGWIVPLTAARTDHVAFTAMVDAPAVSYGLEGAYSRITGEDC